jgi:ATP-dependent Lon protease
MDNTKDNITSSNNNKSTTKNNKKMDNRHKQPITNRVVSSDEDNNSNDGDYESDNEQIDMVEYRKMLSSMFPSRHMNKQMKLQENIKKVLEEDDESIDDIDSYDNSESDSEYDSECDDDDMLTGKPIGFNILFTINGNESDEEDEYDSSDESYKTEDAENDEKDDKTISGEESCEEEPEKKRVKKHSKKVSKQKLARKLCKEDGPDVKVKSRITPTTIKTRSKEKILDKKDTSQNVKSIDKQIEHDDYTSDAFKDMLKIVKDKNGDSKSELIQRFEKLLEVEDSKLQIKKEKELLKIKSKNSKKFRKLLYTKTKQNEIKYFKTCSIEQQEELIEKMNEINKHTHISKPYKVSLIESNIPINYKASAIKKINSLNYMDQGSGEYYKIKEWVDTFMKIPFGNYASLPITIDDGIDKCSEFMENARDILNDAVYGLDDAKLQILQMMAQWISNPKAMGSAIAIKGPMGTGKTTLVKDGISKILNRPFAFIALGGATDSSFLEGHSYTYEGSVWGKIIEIIIQSKCMNPVIYFDELDKVSDTAKGEEIIGILTHLTDTTQNSQFHDKYFSGVDFDLSKCLFIFSYNDESKVNPILKDRMYRIQTQGYNGVQKNTISKNYLIPSIERNIKFNYGDITITDKAIEYMIREYTDSEKGVRNLKRCIEIIYTKLNMFRLMKPKTKLFNDVETFEVNFPFKVDETTVDKLIKKNQQEKRYTSMYI